MIDFKEFEYNVTKFVNFQLNCGHKITGIAFNSRGAWEGCEGVIEFSDGTTICISDTVRIYDKNDNEINEVK